MKPKNYNRDRTIALLTGIVCFLITLAGTALGAIEAWKALALFALLTIAGYLIADLVMAWAAYIDYKEDGTMLEWVSWAVKFILAAVLIFQGAMIAYRLFNQAETVSSEKSRTERVIEVRKQTKDRRLARQVNADEIKAGEEIAKAKSGNWAEQYMAWPAWRYVPAFAGIACLLILTLAHKICPKQTDETEKPAREKKEPEIERPKQIKPLSPPVLQPVTVKDPQIKN